MNSNVLQLGNTKIILDQAKPSNSDYKQFSGAVLQSIQRREDQRVAIETFKLKNTLLIPTNEHEIQLRLRLLSQPIHLFGEQLVDKRERLKDCYTVLSLNKQLDEFNVFYNDYVARHQVVINTQSDVQQELRNYELELVKKQKQAAFLIQLDAEQTKLATAYKLRMLEYSLASAQCRMKREAAWRKKLGLLLDQAKQNTFCDLTLKNIRLNTIPVQYRKYIKQVYEKLRQQELEKIRQQDEELKQTKKKEQQPNNNNNNNNNTLNTTATTSTNTTGDFNLFGNNNNDAGDGGFDLFGTNNSEFDMFAFSTSTPSDLATTNSPNNHTNNTNNNNNGSHTDNNAMADGPAQQHDTTSSSPPTATTTTTTTIAEPAEVDETFENDTTLIPNYLLYHEQLQPTPIEQERRQYSLEHLHQAQNLSKITSLYTTKCDTRVLSASCVDNYNQFLYTGSWSSMVKGYDLLQMTKMLNARNFFNNNNHHNNNALESGANTNDDLLPKYLYIGHTDRVIDIVTPHYDNVDDDAELHQIVYHNHNIACISSAADGSICIWPQYRESHHQQSGDWGDARLLQLNLGNTQNNNGDFISSRAQHDADEDNTMNDNENVKDEVKDEMNNNQDNVGMKNEDKVNINNDEEEDDDNNLVNTRHRYISKQFQQNYEREVALQKNKKIHQISPIHRINNNIMSFHNNNNTNGEYPTHRSNKLLLHHNNQFLYTTSHDMSIKTYDLSTGGLIYTQRGHTAPTYCLGLHQDGSLLACGDLGGHARVWDTRSGRSVMTLEGHGGEVLGCDFSREEYSHVLATASADNSTKLWDMRMRRCVYTIPTHKKKVVDCKFSRKQPAFLATTSFDGGLTLFSLATMSIVKHVQNTGHLSQVSRVNWWDAGCYKARVLLNREPQQQQQHPNIDSHVERCLITSGFDTNIKLWGAF